MDITELKEKHMRQMAALREQEQGPWEPLKQILEVDQVFHEICMGVPEGVEVKMLEGYLKENCEGVELHGDKHWLAQLGVSLSSTMRYVFGWEDIEYHTDETIKYLREARDGLVKEIKRVVSEDKSAKKTLYLSSVEFVAKVAYRIEIHMNILHKLEVHDA